MMKKPNKIQKDCLELYYEARDEVRNVQSSIKYATTFDLSPDVINDLKERLVFAIKDFENACDRLEENGIKLSHLLLEELGYEMFQW